MPRERGLSGLGFSFRILPFSTTAMMEHLLTHISQVVGTSTRASAGAACFAKGRRQETVEASVPVAALPAAKPRNFLRSMASDSWPAGRVAELVLAAGFRLQRIGGVVGEEGLHVAQLVLGYVLGEGRYCAFRFPRGS